MILKNRKHSKQIEKNKILIKNLELEQISEIHIKNKIKSSRK